MNGDNTITITTSSKDLWGALHMLRIEGVTRVPHLETKDRESLKVYKFVLHIASEVAAGLFVAWLAEQLISHPESLTQIQNKTVTHDRSQITNVIMEHVTINNYYREKQPD